MRSNVLDAVGTVDYGSNVAGERLSMFVMRRINAIRPVGTDRRAEVRVAQAHETKPGNQPGVPHGK